MSIVSFMISGITWRLKCDVFCSIRPSGMDADGRDMTICITGWEYTRIVVSGGSRSISLNSRRKAVWGKPSLAV